MDLSAFDRFLTERRYLKNISPRTSDFYADVRRALERFHKADWFTKESLVLGDWTARSNKSRPLAS